MKKERYEKLDLELVKFSAADVLAISGDTGSGDDDELPFVPVNDDKSSQ